jgi:hypothetical protein
MQSAVGMTAKYIHEQRQASTFELDLTRTGSASVGGMIDVTTGRASRNSSLRFVHRIKPVIADARSPASCNRVHLDMDARRSTPIPDELRADTQASGPDRLTGQPDWVEAGSQDCGLRLKAGPAPPAACAA